MNFPIPFIRPPIIAEPAALVRVVSLGDVAWNRPERHVFKAPPLQVRPPLADVAALAADRRRNLTAA